MRDGASLRLETDGAQLFAGALSAADVEDLLATLSGLQPDRAGVRLQGLAGLAEPLAAQGAIGRVAATALGASARPVRAVLFDKSPTNNWKLGWHQDRTVVVRRRVETDGYGPWSRKSGLQHVAPPFAVLEAMVTLRAHLDPVRETNAPLLVAPGSHRLGKIAEPEIPAVVERCGAVACLAQAGDIWLYATPIVHASDAALPAVRRRVLQVDYAVEPLAEGLDWLGV